MQDLDAIVRRRDHQAFVNKTVTLIREGVVKNLLQIERWLQKHHPNAHCFALTPGEAMELPLPLTHALIEAKAVPLDAFGNLVPYFAFVYIAATEDYLDMARAVIRTREEVNERRLRHCGFLTPQ